MQSIPPSPFHSNSITLTSNSTVPIADSAATTNPDQSPTSSKKDRLSRAPDCVHHITSEWLAEKEMLCLMQTSKRQHWLVKEYYRNKLKAAARDSTHRAKSFRNTALRTDRSLPLDPAGRAYLASLGIFHPMVVEIERGQKTLDEALELINDRRHLVKSTVDSTSLSRQQHDNFRNHLFAEHIWSGRCEIATARRLAHKGIHLFYAMTLQNLFRSGDLHPTDLEGISNPGLRLLHDPLLVGLFQDGLITKQEIQQLTKTQFESLFIFRPVLASRTVPVKSILALTKDRIENLRYTRVLQEVIAGRMTLGQALHWIGRDFFPIYSKGTVSEIASCQTLQEQTDLQLLRNRPNRSAMHAALFGDLDDLNWIKAVGRVMHHHSPDQIIHALDTSDVEERTAFAALTDGLMTDGAEDMALAYIQIYINLAEHLSSSDYLRVVKPFLSDVMSLMVAEAYYGNFPNILDQCRVVWSLVQTKCAVSGFSIKPVRDLVVQRLKEKLKDQELFEGYAQEKCIASFGRFLAAMDLLDTDELITIWVHETRGVSVEIENPTLECFQALCSAFDGVEFGVTILETLSSLLGQRRSSGI